MNGVAQRMNELLVEVVASAEAWAEVSERECSKAECEAHEDLVQAILAYADEYEGFAEIQKVLGD